MVRIAYDRLKCVAAAAALTVLAVSSAFSQSGSLGDGIQYQRDYVRLVKHAAPSVVNIFAKRLVSERVSPFANDPLFRDFFRGFGQIRPRIQNSLGSGVILGEDGFVVTNYHVVAEASQIRVVLNDRREFDAEVVLGDEDFDLAVLNLIDAEDLPVLELRNSDDVQIGEIVLAIGNPFGVGQTVSSGIVSGLMPGRTNGYFIQTDAPIYAGNSGGALIDIEGRLVGINTALQIHTDGLRGIGFAIPANLVDEFVDQARNGMSRFLRPWAGVSVQEMDQSLADAMAVERPEGVLVLDIHPESPFKAASLRPGDIIVGFNGQRIGAGAEFLFRISAEGIGEVVEIEFVRDGRLLTRAVAMIPPPETPARNQTLLGGSGPLNGLRVSNVNPAVIMEYSLEVGARGVIVVEALGALARFGLNAGDLLLRINGEEVHDVSDMERLSETKSRNWQIEFLRQGRVLAIRLRV